MMPPKASADRLNGGRNQTADYTDNMDLKKTTSDSSVPSAKSKV
jgi:hypothetical protein